MRCRIALCIVVFAFEMSRLLLAADGNRLTYLDEFCDPYYVGRDFPKLTTPQWVGEEGVEAVVVLAIDDMRDTAKYETYLRPILDRLKKIDGRAPVSIMTCNVDPRDPQLQSWLKEGLSIEIHTVDHPCPLLQKGDFGKAKSSYDRCVDLMNEISGNKPVAFRMPCCDSKNTPSPRFWVEIFNKTTEKGNFLSIDTSVFHIFTPKDRELPRELVLDKDGKERFRKYIPFPSFVNWIEDYPYPYVISRKCWQFPCVVPSDWEAQNLQKPFNPKTVEDMKVALDATVIKKGVYNLVFHPHGWIRNAQIVELIDHAVKKHGKKVKFLTFREANDRLNKNLLGGHPLRNTKGQDNGVRLLDIDNDGLMDVVIGNNKVRQTRLWSTKQSKWIVGDFPVSLVRMRGTTVSGSGSHFGVFSDDGSATVIGPRPIGWHFVNGKWIEDDRMWRGVPFNSFKPSGRLRDLDGDGVTELIEADWESSNVMQWDKKRRQWDRLSFVLPAGRDPSDEAALGDVGLRFVDVNQDGHDDVMFSDEKRFSLHLFKSMDSGWSIEAVRGRRSDESRIPMIVRPTQTKDDDPLSPRTTNNGAWFHSRTLWVQNEDTDRLPDGVDRISFDQLLKPKRGH